MPTFSSQPDETGAIDTFILEGTPDGTRATTTTIGISDSAGTRRRGLIKFDVSSIPSGATVTSATLSLWNESSPGADRTFTIHPILAANNGWIEACSWNYANPSTQRWAGDTGADGGTDAGCTVSGTDYNATAMGSVTVTAGTAAGTEHQISLNTTAVQAWVNGNNYGMVIVPAQTSFFEFRSSSYGTASNRPKLVIEYTTGVGLAGTSAGAATTTAVLLVEKPLAAQTPGMAAVGASLWVEKPLAGAGAGVATVNGGLQTLKRLAGATVTGAATGAVLRVEKRLAGGIAGQSSASGVLSGAAGVLLAGAVAGVLVAAGSLRVLKQLAGGVSGQSAAGGSLLRRLALAGATTAQATSAASLLVRKALAGVAGGVSSLAGALAGAVIGMPGVIMVADRAVSRVEIASEAASRVDVGDDLVSRLAVGDTVMG